MGKFIINRTQKIVAQLQLVLYVILIVIFPFGLLPQLRLQEEFIRINLIDIIVGLLASTYIFTIEKIKFRKYVWVIIGVYVFSFIIALITKSSIDIRASLYLIRLITFLLVPISIFNIVSSMKNPQFLLRLLITSGCMTALLGLLQYIFYPDMRDLKYLGFDDHFYRLISLHFDPNLVGGIFILTFISIYFSLDFSSKAQGVLLGFLTIAIALTFSRSSYVSLGILVGFLFLKFKTKMLFLLLGMVFFVTLLFAPRPGGEGVNLFRTHSIHARNQNYAFSWEIIQKNPFFGIGYNTLCSYKLNSGLKNEDIKNSCGGLDSSIFQTLATVGLVGTGMIAYSIFRIYHILRSSPYKFMLFYSFIAILIHSMFSNSLYYSWVLIYLMILLGLASSITKHSEV